MALIADKKTEIIRFAERQLASRGVHSFSFRDVAAACNIKSSSVHYHFPKKNDLIIAVLNQFEERSRQQFEQWNREVSDPRQRLKNYLEHIRVLAKECSNDAFCPMMMAATEMAAEDPEIIKVTHKFFDAAVEWLKQQLKEIRNHTELMQEDAVDAELIYQMLEGGMISVRVTGEPHRIETVLNTIERQVLHH